MALPPLLSSMRWVSIVTAPDQLTAELWCELLIQNGIPAALEAGDAVSFLGVSSFPVRLMAPEEREEDARRFLADIFADAPLGEDLEES